MSLMQILMDRDDLTDREARELINEASADLRGRLAAGEMVDDGDFMLDWFGLEPDHVLDLL